MKLNRQTLGNIAIVMVAVVLFGAFVVLGTRGGHKKNALATVASTSTTRRSTTTTESETTTSQLLETTTTAPPPATTVAPTPTTSAHTTATTRPKSTTTTFACPAAGPQSTEASDNSSTFTESDGSFSSSSTQPPSNAGALRFTIQTEKATGPNGEQNYVKFSVTMTNTTANHCFAFPGGTADVAMTLHPSSGSDITFDMTAGGQAPLQPGDSITLAQSRGVSNGTFQVTATCGVNYG